MASQPKPAATFIRPGFHTITPYLLVPRAAEFIEFLKTAFGGAERLRVPLPNGLIMHAEVQIGDSIIELGDPNEQYPAAPTAIHLYVDDADAVYARALQAGASSLYEPADQPWGDHQGAVNDAFGNLWYIATNKSWTPAPGEELLTVQPYLHLSQRRQDDSLPPRRLRRGSARSGQITRRHRIARHHQDRQRDPGNR